ncbi:TonB-dependent siderophore receptor [Psychrobacter pygoscelis]|uniref:TonB-dependent siderophore receptor n=1 Tax=Psychrobacter pygoscelis TaxID=2488563 RepID=UPI001040421F|nr:TonB-dependent siderophore receptor [Psychrobacter pygoscelis]
MPPSFKLATLTLAVNAALITPVAAQAADEDLPLVTLPTITVTAETETETADGPVDGIAASTVSSTTGFDESILKSTQSVTVVGQQEVESIGANNLLQALDYSTGISRGLGSDTTTEDFRIRGFKNVSTYKDGHKYSEYYFGGQQELYGIERIEVLKGPGSLLNGALPPGGLINTVSKKPFFDNQYEINAEVGSFSRKQVAADLNHQVNDDIAVRLVGVYRDSDTFVDFVPDDRTFIAPSLTWQASKDTSLTLHADYQRDLTKYVPGFPVEVTLEPSSAGKVPLGRYSGTPNFDEFDHERTTIGYTLDHNISPNLKIQNYLNQTETTLNFPWTYLDDQIGDIDSTIYGRAIIQRNTDTKQTNAGLSAIYNWTLNDRIENVALIGIDYTKGTFNTVDLLSEGSSIDIMNPDYNHNNANNNFSVRPYFYYENTRDEVGLFLQNQITVDDRWVGVLGLRHDKINLDTDYVLESIEDEDGDYNATTGRVGLVYLMDNGIAPYVSMNQSFEAEIGVDRDGNQFEPTEGIQYEAGVRYQPEGSDTLLTGSVFRINQTNVLVDDPENYDFQIQQGEVRSQGVELEAKTKIGNNSNLIAAYAYTDARTVEASPLYPEKEGQRVSNVPFNTLSLWGDYRFANFGMPQLKVGVGVRYKDEALLPYSSTKYPSYTVVDAMASYDWSDNINLALNINNLLDKEYIICGWACDYGEPRNVVGKVTYKW